MYLCKVHCITVLTRIVNRRSLVELTVLYVDAYGDVTVELRAAAVLRAHHNDVGRDAGSALERRVSIYADCAVSLHAE